MSLSPSFRVFSKYVKTYSAFILFILIVAETDLFAKCLLEICFAVVPWREDKIKKLTENGQSKFADMTWKPLQLLHGSKCNSMLIIYNSGLVYEEKKLRSSPLLIFCLCISVIYSKVTENLLLLLFPSICFYQYVEMQAQSKFRTTIQNH